MAGVKCMSTNYNVVYTSTVVNVVNTRDASGRDLGEHAGMAVGAVAELGSANVEQASLKNKISQSRPSDVPPVLIIMYRQSHWVYVSFIPKLSRGALAPCSPLKAYEAG